MRTEFRDNLSGNAHLEWTRRKWVNTIKTGSKISVEHFSVGNDEQTLWPVTLK
jgi:hypothetical protein